MIQVAEKDTSLRKAAILIDSLSEAIGDQLLSQMSLEKAAGVRSWIEQLTEVDPMEREDILNEFLKQTGWRREDVMPDSEPDFGGPDGSVELQLSSPQLLDSAANEVSPATSSTTADPRPEVMSTPSRQRNLPLGFVDEAQAATLADLIRGESEQLGAVMLSLLDPAIAAKVLEHFPPDQQTDLLRRLSHTGPADPQTIAEIVQMVHDWLSDDRVASTLATGWHAVKQILSNAGWPHQQQLWDQVRPDAAQDSTGDVPQDRHRDEEMRTNDRSDQSSTASSLETHVVGPLKIFRGDAAHEPNDPLFRAESVVSGESDPSAPSVAGRGSSERPVVAPVGSDTQRQSPESTGGSERGVNVETRASLLPSGITTPGEEERAIAPPEQISEQRTPTSQSSFDLATLNPAQVEQRFDELQHWPARPLIQVLKGVPPKVMMLALTGAQPRLLARVKKSLSRREAARVTREIERSGPVRLADICKAQLAVLAMADELQQEGPSTPQKRNLWEA